MGRACSLLWVRFLQRSGPQVLCGRGEGGVIGGCVSMSAACLRWLSCALSDGRGAAWRCWHRAAGSARLPARLGHGRAQLGRVCCQGHGRAHGALQLQLLLAALPRCASPLHR